MDEVEFYIYGNELWCKYADGRNKIVTEQSSDIVQPMLDIIMERYPEAYKALEREYRNSSANIPYYQFLIVRRFCKCNFGKLDTTKADVTKNGTFNFEKVECPLRGECKHEGVICFPKFNSKLSEQELRVMELIYKGATNYEVGENLYISPHTVKNHMKSVYCKLGIHEKSEFIRYANDNNLFNL